MAPPPVTILPALESRLDYSLLHAARARCAARERHAADKLARLRRLAQQAVFHTLPETRAEQSWNEQLFAKVLGYRTLLSHDALPFHLLPKNAVGRRRFDDFSLGFFGAGDDVVLGTAELKSPGADLDAPQTSGNYDGKTPVEQGLSAALAHGPPCRWLLVSNLRELRLYDVHSPGSPVAVVKDLGAIRNRDDLALLCAPFDAAALLGEPGKDNAEMSALLDTDPIFRPLPAQAGYCRLILRFVRSDGPMLPLFRIEKALREAADALFEHLAVPIADRTLRIAAKDGWVATEPLPHTRLAANRFGEVLLSTRIEARPESLMLGDQAKVLAKIDASTLIDAAVRFAKATSAFKYASSDAGRSGTVGGELREVAQVALTAGRMQEPTAPGPGVCTVPDISVGDFDCEPGSHSNLADSLASCLCEFAIQFRSPQGGVGLSHHRVMTHIKQQLSSL